MRAPATEFDADAIDNVVGSTLSFPSAVADWRVVAWCGRGGTAEVWHAVAADGREAALKRLRPELRSSVAVQQRLRRELTLLRTIRSPFLVTPLELIELTDGPALVLEYLPNGDLVSLLGSEPRHWLPALRGVLAAVRSLHEHGVAHGDVKARNVLFARDQSARLIDLTAARPVDAPAARSTAAYSLPPGSRATAATADVFAVAALTFELATARLPYGADGPTRGALRPAAGAVVAQVAPLLAAATAMLEAGGDLPAGLSYLAGVIESVGAAGA
jgi:serine/threonine protein kinase